MKIPRISKAQRSEWDVWTVEDDVEYLFRSQLRTATPAKISDSQSFTHALFQSHDAWLPNLDWFPYQKIQTATIGLGVAFDNRPTSINLNDVVKVYAICQSSRGN